VIFYLAWPLICVLLAAIPLALLWRTPRRVTLLRPFGYASRLQPLRSLATDVLARWGHTYALSDGVLKEPWYSRSFLLGTPGVLALPNQNIRTAADWWVLQTFLKRRFARNLNWLVSRYHVFTLRSSDECWRSTVGSLVSNSQLVVVDVTGLESGVVEEIEDCRLAKRITDVIFVVDADERDAARAHFQGDAELRVVPLFVWPEAREHRGELLRYLEPRRARETSPCEH
jgi:hypothetical protein